MITADTVPDAGEAILEGWKAIASAMNCSVRAAQGYASTRGLPVHGRRAAGLGRVWARPSALAAWCVAQDRMPYVPTHSEATRSDAHNARTE